MCLHLFSAKNQSSCSTVIEVGVLSVYAHNTVELLSQKLPMYLNVYFTMAYLITSHPKTIPANARSLVDNFPFFLSDTSSFWMYVIHVNCHTQVYILCSPGMMIRISPILQASVYCKYYGYSLTNIWTGVRFSTKCFTRVRQSFSAATKYGVVFM